MDMKILAIGDTHGKLNKVRDIWPKLKNIDLIIHTGDHYEDGLDLSDEFGVPVVAVKGNCDGGGREDYEIIETEAGNILLTHGHSQHVSYDYNALMYRAMELDCVAAVFGHTHCCEIEQIDDLWLINPGSLTQPRDGTGGSYAIIRTSEDDFNASIVYYNTVMGLSRGGSAVEGHGGHGGANSDEKPGSSNSSGFLKNLFNYTDRF